MQGPKMYRWGWRIVGLATIMALLPVAAWACSVCFEGDDALARGLNMSILFLMSMPFTIFGAIFGVVYFTQKRAQRQGCKGLAWSQGESAKWASMPGMLQWWSRTKA